MKSQAAINWIRNYAIKVKNHLESVWALWLACNDDGVAFSWERLKKHFRVFRDAEEPKQNLFLDENTKNKRRK